MLENHIKYNGKAEYYEKFRLPYAKDIAYAIIEVTGLDKKTVIADIGSGTGRLSEMFIREVNKIYGVEPNDEMRALSEKKFENEFSFISLKGFSEDTKLEDKSIDIIMCGQAVHWFSPKYTLKEFRRILKSNGWIIFVWNKFGNEEYPQIYDFIDSKKLKMFSFPGKIKENFEAFFGGAISVGDNPNPGDLDFDTFKKKQKQYFEKYAENGLLTVTYETVLVIGKLK